VQEHAISFRPTRLGRDPRREASKIVGLAWATFSDRPVTGNFPSYAGYTVRTGTFVGTSPGFLLSKAGSAPEHISY
jgi:hypothetical protein